MDKYTFIVNFFQEGGVFLYFMAALFAVGIAIAIERFVVLTQASISNRQLWEKITPWLKAGNYTEAANVAAKSGTALGTVLSYGLARAKVTHRRDDLEKAMEESLLEIIPKLEKRTHFLSSLANVGMLIGLLGTVAGLISAFGAIATANPAEKASLLAASISVAMNNTAGGLFVAITLLLAHMYLESKTTGLIDSLEIAALKFLNSVTERAPAAPVQSGSSQPSSAQASSAHVPASASAPAPRAAATARGTA
ncbi:MAG: MotA/TolQ/ExbB proton channel family protein [Gammaproteobacteria bacterium]